MKNGIKLLAAFLVVLGIASCSYKKQEAATEAAPAASTEAVKPAEAAPEAAEATEAEPMEEVPMEEAAPAAEPAPAH
jgi:uncharacterized lipoprotein